MKFTGLKVFSATKANDRDCLGEKITDWLQKNPDLIVADTVITQSSDSEFHCLTITVFYTGTVSWNPPSEHASRNGSGYSQQRRT